jgi:hypothetical protein
MMHFSLEVWGVLLFPSSFQIKPGFSWKVKEASDDR